MNEDTQECLSVSMCKSSHIQSIWGRYERNEVNYTTITTLIQIRWTLPLTSRVYYTYMDHIAIMKKDWKLIPKIKNGTKVIESRWYINKVAPWGKIQSDETIYFKNSGEPITLTAKVDKVLSFEDLTPEKVMRLLEQYGKEDGIEEKDIQIFFERFKNKKYCLLIYLKDIQEVEPFSIDKSGFGNMSAWISVKNIKSIRYK
jgi:hypothetical protein